MSIEFLLLFCALCTAIGMPLAYLKAQVIFDDELEVINEDDICIVCGKACDNYEHWTRGG